MFSQLDQELQIWGKNTTGVRCSYYHITERGGSVSTWPITDVHFIHLVKGASDSSLHHKDLICPVFYFVH